MERNLYKKTVMDAVRANGGNATFADLERETGLMKNDLLTAIGSLAQEDKILIRINHAADVEQTYRSNNDFLYERFMDLLFVHAGKERSVSFYASELCITPKYLSAVVKQVSGKTPSVLIGEACVRVIEHALCHTQDTIKEISLNLGFTNLSFFGKFFKKHKGVSPRRYREAYLAMESAL